MKRLNFTFDDSTIELLEELSDNYFSGNKSQTVREALESLKVNIGNKGWVIKGYTPRQLEEEIQCYSCGEDHHAGEILFTPVFEKGSGVRAINALPKKPWVECDKCVDSED